MEYTTRIVRSSEGLTKEAALLGLQEHPSFMPGTKIANIYNQGGRWVAKLMEPKVAEAEVEPCEHCEDKGCQHCKKTAAGAFEDIDESPADLHDEKHEEFSELPLEIETDEEHEEKHEQSEEKKLKDLEKKLDLLLDALGISEKGEEPEVSGAPKNEGPADLPVAPEPAKGPKHEPLPPGSGAKLKPGEVPNKPGMTPVGAPSFASVKTAGCEGSCDEGTCEDCDSKHKEANTSMPPNAIESAQPDDPAASGPVKNACPKCNGSNPECTECGESKIASFTASKLDAGNTLTIRQAKAQLENHYEGFRVARIKRDGNAIHARLEKQ